MADLFQVDFYVNDTSSGLYGQVVHSLIDADDDRKIIEMSESASKLSGVSNYTREPHRVEFSCFLTDWMGDNLLSGEYEHERYISKYSVRIWRNDVTMFMGIIDCSRLKYDVATEIIEITCYDKTKLLPVYNDLEQYYSIAAGYQPIWILRYFLQAIQQRMPIGISWVDNFTLPELQQADLEIASIDYSDVASATWPWPYHGWVLDTGANVPIHCYAYTHTFTTTSGGVTYYRNVSRASIYRIYNATCMHEVDTFEESTSWSTGLAEVLENVADMFTWFEDHGYTEDEIRYQLQPEITVNDRDYTSLQSEDDCVQLLFTGNVLPSLLQPGEAYEEHDDSKTNRMKVLQAMLMLYNATIHSNAGSNVVLANKPTGSTGTATEIDDAHVVSMTRTRVDQEAPDTSVLDVLAGDTTVLQGVISDWLTEYHAGKLQIELTITEIDAYDLALFDVIEIRHERYQIVSIQRDLKGDTYKIKGWRV